MYKFETLEWKSKVNNKNKKQKGWFNLKHIGVVAFIVAIVVNNMEIYESNILVKGGVNMIYIVILIVLMCRWKGE